MMLDMNALRGRSINDHVYQVSTPPMDRLVYLALLAASLAHQELRLVTVGPAGRIVKVRGRQPLRSAALEVSPKKKEQRQHCSVQNAVPAMHASAV